jgi:O-antigen/teichoic acid export membrane protein
MFILSTPDYYDGVPLLKILITALALPILIQILGIGSSIAKFTSHITYAVIVAGIINLVVLFLLMPYLGITSGPVALLVGNLSMLAIRYYYAEKDYYINYNLKKILSAILVLILSLILLLIFEIHLLFKVCFFLFIVVLTTFNRHKILRSIKNIEEI